MKTSDFLPSSVAYKLPRKCFADLTPRQKSRVLRLVAQVSEKSYRRGLQHGVVLSAEKAIVKDVAIFRYTPAMDKSPDADGFRTLTSVERVQQEYIVLHALGF